MVVRILGFVVVVLHRNDAVLEAAKAAAEYRRGLPQLDGVLTVNAALYDVAVRGQVLNTVRNERREQLVAELDAAVLRAGVVRRRESRARLTAEVEEHELAVLGDGKGHGSVGRAVYQVGFVVLNQVVGVFIGDADGCGRVSLHGERVVARRQVERTAELALGAEGVQAGDIQRRRQINGCKHHDGCDKTDEQLSLVRQTRNQLFAHENLEYARGGAAGNQHDDRQERAGHIIAEALDRYRADNQCDNSRLHEQQEQVHALVRRAEHEHRKARHDEHAERTHRKRKQIGNRIHHQQNRAQNFLTAARGSDHEPERQQARNRHQARVGVRVAENGIQTGIEVRAGVAVARADRLHDDAHRAHQDVAGRSVNRQQTDRSGGRRNRSGGAAEGDFSVLREQNNAQIHRKGREKHRKLRYRKLARTGVER